MYKSDFGAPPPRRPKPSALPKSNIAQPRRLSQGPVIPASVLALNKLIKMLSEKLPPVAGEEEIDLENTDMAAMVSRLEHKVVEAVALLDKQAKKPPQPRQEAKPAPAPAPAPLQNSIRTPATGGGKQGGGGSGGDAVDLSELTAHFGVAKGASNAATVASMVRELQEALQKLDALEGTLSSMNFAPVTPREGDGPERLSARVDRIVGLARSTKEATKSLSSLREDMHQLGKLTDMFPRTIEASKGPRETEAGRIFRMTNELLEMVAVMQRQKYRQDQEFRSLMLDVVELWDPSVRLEEAAKGALGGPGAGAEAGEEDDGNNVARWAHKKLTQQMAQFRPLLEQLTQKAMLMRKRVSQEHVHLRQDNSVEERLRFATSVLDASLLSVTGLAELETTSRELTKLAGALEEGFANVPGTVREVEEPSLDYVKRVCKMVLNEKLHADILGDRFLDNLLDVLTSVRSLRVEYLVESKEKSVERHVDALVSLVEQQHARVMLAQVESTLVSDLLAMMQRLVPEEVVAVPESATPVEQLAHALPVLVKRFVVLRREQERHEQDAAILAEVQTLVDKVERDNERQAARIHDMQESAESLLHLVLGWKYNQVANEDEERDRDLPALHRAKRHVEAIILFGDSIATSLEQRDTEMRAQTERQKQLLRALVEVLDDPVPLAPNPNPNPGADGDGDGGGSGGGGGGGGEEQGNAPFMDFDVLDLLQSLVVEFTKRKEAKAAKQSAARGARGGAAGGARRGAGVGAGAGRARARGR